MRPLAAPPRAKPGDTVAVIAPSAPAVAWWPHRVERGRAYLESLGLGMRIMPNAAGDSGWVSATPQERAADIHEAFLDDSVGVVLAAIGGNHSNQILPYLDFDLIAKHPKILQGYSDTTVLLWAIAQRCRFRTFHGPALTVELAEYPAVLPYTDRYQRQAWFGDKAIVYEPATEWTEEFLDFFEKKDLSRGRTMAPSSGWLTVRPGAASGVLLGGCLETICWHLKGSGFWPDLVGSILFFDTSEEAPSPEEVDAYLTDLEQLNVFNVISGLIVGRPMRYTTEQTETLWRVVRERTEASGIPVLANVDCGHTDPMMTLPIGCPAHMDAGRKKLALTAAPTA